jgi:hypothetical protein
VLLRRLDQLGQFLARVEPARLHSGCGAPRPCSGDSRAKDRRSTSAPGSSLLLQQWPGQSLATIFATQTLAAETGLTDQQTDAPAFGYPAKDQRELAAECRRLKSMLVSDKRPLP